LKAEVKREKREVKREKREVKREKREVKREKRESGSHKRKLRRRLHKRPMLQMDVWLREPAVSPEISTTGLSGICILKMYEKKGYRWVRNADSLRTSSRRR